MNKRLITIAATAMALAAPAGAAAAMPSMAGHTLENSAGPTTADRGGSTSPSAPTPVTTPDTAEATASDDPTIAEVPGTIAETAPVGGATSPEVPVASQSKDDETEGTDPEACADYADQIDALLAEGQMLHIVGSALGGWGSPLGGGVMEKVGELDAQMRQHEEDAREEGCYGDNIQ